MVLHAIAYHFSHAVGLAASRADSNTNEATMAGNS